mmetsp:Transcript_18258/g.36878  ORF Transcript_18258/g.36878 Transcript_18258/m.36878 type:complete len:253 (-) Transcript_18258:1395-2153(-)
MALRLAQDPHASKAQRAGVARRPRAALHASRRMLHARRTREHAGRRWPMVPAIRTVYPCLLRNLLEHADGHVVRVRQLAVEAVLWRGPPCIGPRLRRRRRGELVGVGERVLVVVIIKAELGILPALGQRPLVVLVVDPAITEESHILVAYGAQVRQLLLLLLIFTLELCYLISPLHLGRDVVVVSSDHPSLCELIGREKSVPVRVRLFASGPVPQQQVLFDEDDHDGLSVCCPRGRVRVDGRLELSGHEDFL